MIIIYLTRDYTIIGVYTHVQSTCIKVPIINLLLLLLLLLLSNHI
jgi:hypothetical protein